jgi:acetoin:2,6-dichlorophenolindophenol oxidoreductase subunit beta
MPEAREITYRAGIIEALREEMREDPSVIVMGEDVGAAGGVFKQTEGLFAEFGAERVIDTPISESGAFGIAVGAAMTGLRPVFEVMFGDFLTLVMDQLVNQAAKVHYMSNARPAHDHRNGRQPRPAAFAKPLRLGGACPRAEGGRALDGV